MLLSGKLDHSIAFSREAFYIQSKGVVLDEARINDW